MGILTYNWVLGNLVYFIGKYFGDERSNIYLKERLNILFSSNIKTHNKIICNLYIFLRFKRLNIHWVPIFYFTFQYCILKIFFS